MAAPPPTSASDDYSTAATVITFPLPLPLVRHPLPSSNPPLLTFPTRHSFFSALSSARPHLLSQCESGARIGCSLRASARCQPPWWHSLLGGAPRGFAERAECEERESRECFEAARGECVRVVKEITLISNSSKQDKHESPRLKKKSHPTADLQALNCGLYQDIKLQTCHITTSSTINTTLLSFGRYPKI